MFSSSSRSCARSAEPSVTFGVQADSCLQAVICCQCCIDEARDALIDLQVEYRLCKRLSSFDWSSEAQMRRC